MRADVAQMSDVIEKRTFEEVELHKQLDRTEAIASTIRDRHREALGSNVDVQNNLILNETMSQEKRMDFQRILSSSSVLNDRIDIQECERVRLNETVQRLE